MAAVETDSSSALAVSPPLPLFTGPDQEGGGSSRSCATTAAHQEEAKEKKKEEGEEEKKEESEETCFADCLSRDQSKEQLCNEGD